MGSKARILVAGLCLGLQACSESKIEDSLSNYLSRLSNVIEYPSVPEYATRNSIGSRFPRLKQQNQPAGSTIGLLDFLSLYGCELQVLIGQKNSGLGRLSQASQDLIYDLKFLSLAPRCQTKLNNDTELSRTLTQAIMQKQRQLPKKIVSAVLLGQEARTFWQIPLELDDYPNNVGPDLPLAIARLNQLVSHWLNGDYQAGTGELENLLAHLNTGEGGILFRALLRYQDMLDTANQMIEQRSPSLCFNGRAQLNTGAARNVVEKYFVGDVQAWASILNQRYYQIHEEYVELEGSLLEDLPPVYITWRDQRIEQLRAALESSKLHVAYLKRVLEPCSDAS